MSINDVTLARDGALEATLEITGCLALSPALCKATRGILEWTQEELAERSAVSRSTIRDYEGCKHNIHRSTAAQICAAFEREGVMLMYLSGIGSGLWKFEGEVVRDDTDHVAT